MTNGGLAKYNLNPTLPVAMIIAAFTALAWSNALELNFQIWTTFKRRKGLYYWSVNIASWGVILHALAVSFQYFGVIDVDYVNLVFLTIGWYAMVTGQAVMLYSRIHLVTPGKKNPRWVLYMIIVDAIIFHIPTTVFVFATTVSNDDKYVLPYMIMEKVQSTGFGIQDCIISAVYIYYARRMLKSHALFADKTNRARLRVLKNLIRVSVIVVLMDSALIACEYINLYQLESVIKPTIYAIKLRFEFSILNRLRAILHSGDNNIHHNAMPLNDGRDGDIKYDPDRKDSRGQLLQAAGPPGQSSADYYGNNGAHRTRGPGKQVKRKRDRHPLEFALGITATTEVSVHSMDMKEMSQSLQSTLSSSGNREDEPGPSRALSPIPLPSQPRTAHTRRPRNVASPRSSSPAASASGTPVLGSSPV